MCPSWENKLDFARENIERELNSKHKLLLDRKESPWWACTKIRQLGALDVELNDLQHDNFGQLGHTSLGFQVPIATKNNQKNIRLRLITQNYEEKAYGLVFETSLYLSRRTFLVGQKREQVHFEMANPEKKPIHGKNAFPSVIWLMTENSD